MVHAFGFPSELYAFLAVKLAGRGKVLVVRRNVGYWQTWWGRWKGRLAGLLGFHYAANCEAARDFTAKAEWISRRRVTVISNPAPAGRLRDGLASLLPRSALGVADDEQVVGMVATVRPIKDYATFLRAAHVVLDRLPRTRFIVIGTEQSEYKSQMARLSSELGIDSRVAWLGPLPNPFTVVPSFDVAVLTSRSEAMSNSILEYMTAGIATVATDVGGTRELVDDGQTGFLLPAGNPSALAERVCQLLTDSSLRSLFGDRARRKTETHFAAQRVIHAYRELYFRLAAKTDSAATRSTGRPDHDHDHDHEYMVPDTVPDTVPHMVPDVVPGPAEGDAAIAVSPKETVKP